MQWPNFWDQAIHFTHEILFPHPMKFELLCSSKGTGHSTEGLQKYPEVLCCAFPTPQLLAFPIAPRRLGLFLTAFATFVTACVHFTSQYEMSTASDESLGK